MPLQQKRPTPSGPVLPSNYKVVQPTSLAGLWRGGVASAIQMIGATHEH